VVVNSHGQGFLGLILPDYVFVEERFDLTRFRKFKVFNTRGNNALAELLVNNFVSKRNALITDEYTATGD
jgi:hypothetical protein